MLFSNETRKNEGDSADYGEKPSFSVDIKSKTGTDTKEIEVQPETTPAEDVKAERENFAQSQLQDEEANEELKSPKEKQCWNLYCKMVEKGVNVSFDTILRGMLTPTEYRLSRENFPKEYERGGSSENTS